MRVKHSFLVALAAFACSAGAQDLKPGLWQITHKTRGSGDMAQAMSSMHQQMANLPPEQRKLMQDSMARQGMQVDGAAPGGGMTIKVCMTPEMVQHNQLPATRSDCNSTSQARSGNTMKVAFACTNPPSNGQGEVTFLGPEAYTSKMTVTSGAEGKSQQVTMESSGKWIAADCGKVKPPATRKK
jgi:hypothetical protein